MPQEMPQHPGEPVPALDPSELTNAEIDQVVGGGGDSGEGLQPTNGRLGV
jgi:hypothetical protein